jgi:uncharacterized protein (DUF1800 family)
MSSWIVAGALVFGGSLWTAADGPFAVAATAALTPPIAVTVTGVSEVRVGETAHMTATVGNTSNTAVLWQVNGVTGGSASAGTISATGLYKPPASIPPIATVTISAVSEADSKSSGTRAETLLNPIPILSAAIATQSEPGTTYTLDVKGMGFVKGAAIQLLQTQPPTSLTTTFVSATELQATISVPAGVTAVPIDVANPNPGSATSGVVNAVVNAIQASLASAARLLDQATFGPTLDDIQHVETVGLQGYLNEQFALAPTLEPDITTPPPALCVTNIIPCQQAEWWQAAITASDQLRQRVAFALSEMFVISSNSVNARAITPFQNILVNDAFGNFYSLMKDVTLSPGMGAYLNMLNSAKPTGTQIANENYSRELMQLFTIGLVMLNEDGSPQFNAFGSTTPTYTEAQVQAFARVYTGWTYATATGGVPTSFPNNTPNYDSPMAAVEREHDMNAKVLLNGMTLPAGQSASQDLADALTNIFNHSNVGPFVCRQLIQHLVASNPSSAYVARVAAVFANDGNGVRGNMKAVVQAILLDPDARAGDTSPDFDGGHLREPMLYMTNIIRGLGFTFVGGGAETGPEYYYTPGNYTASLSERPYAAGSVFNFFPPNYVIPGTTLNAPEFGQENTASAVLRLTLANSLVNNGISGFTVNLSATSALGMTASATGNAATDSGNLVDSLGVIFMHGQMPAQMRTDIVNHVQTLTNIPERVRVATYLVITSSFYKIEH